MGALAVLGGAGMAAGIAGSTIGAMGQVSAADAQAKSLDISARSELDQAAFEERQQRRQGSIFMSEAKAETAAAGIDPSRGSPLFAALDMAKQNELQALSIRRSGQVKYNQGKYASEMVRRQIPYDIAQGVLGGISSGISGGTSILSALKEK